MRPDDPEAALAQRQGRPVELHLQDGVIAFGQGVGGGTGLGVAVYANRIGDRRERPEALGAHGYRLHARTGDGEVDGVDLHGDVGLPDGRPKRALCDPPAAGATSHNRSALLSSATSVGRLTLKVVAARA